ncbi:MAG: hypothetical protein KDD62_04555 [Bdellovibrionales bacterium]|nr:hypothetical protein [Bdellovibrionales bacterium]
MTNKHNFTLPLIDVDADAIYEEPNSTGSPERNLLMAILERALLDFVGNEKKQVNAAQEWIFGDSSNDDDGEYFSFDFICEALDLDREHVAQIAKQMPKRGNRKVAPWYFQKWESDSEAA